ncbi:SUKH-4 family immunity protein [Streptomyces sp. NPDC048196]|uniref:SUKH-4 family immunity protein n=1 Tax=Streptomyces sp. NPDC048196 TaxID=3154712 RepID=UPI0033CC6467
MTAESAMARVESWLAEPHRLYETFAIRGAAGTGKTRLLQQLASRVPDAVYLDCRGLTAEEVAHRLLRAWGAEYGAVSLAEAARKVRDTGVAFLANVQWAGPLVSSNEPSRITQQVLRTLKRFSRPDLRFVVERSAEKSWVLAPARNELVLQGDVGPAGPHQHDAEIADLVANHPPLEALAAAEMRSIPVSVWEELCQVWGMSASSQELTELAGRLTEILAVSESDGSEREVSFRWESTRHRIRALRPVDHEAVVDHLRQRMADLTTGYWKAAGPLGTYAAATTALHAAHAGTLEGLLSEGPVLANLDAYGLLQGLAACWPGGVPQGGLPMDAHYLEALGLAHAPQSEWGAWLHQATVSRGNEALAQAMASAGTPLLWRTVWSRCRPYGTFGPSPQAYEESSEGIPVSRSWPRNPSSPPVRHILGSAHPFRTTPESDREWLVAGPTGPFAIEVDADVLVESAPPALPEPFVGTITKSAEWACPAAALDTEAPSKLWLESTFGDGTCCLVRESDMPPGLTHAETRQFLATTGLPSLTDQLPFMSLVNLCESPLIEGEWPEEAEPLDGDGHLFVLGDWTGGTILLDGATGQVLQDLRTGYETPVLASGLRQFCTLLRLYHELLISNFNTPHEYVDARASLRAWAEEIDPVVEDADHWDQVFDGDLDTWGSA